MKRTKSETELYEERVNALQNRLSYFTTGHFRVSELSALVKLQTLIKLPSDEDLTLLEKAAEEIENGTR